MPQTLKHIVGQELTGDLDVEVILVDNNSNDYTKTIAITEWQKLHTNIELKVVEQPIPGLLFSREIVVLNVSHEIVFFVTMIIGYVQIMYREHLRL